MILGKYLLVKLNLMLKLKVPNDCMPLSSHADVCKAVLKWNDDVS